MRFVLSALLVLLGVWFWVDNLATLAQPVAIRLRLPFVELVPFPPGPRIDLLLGLAFVAGFVLAWSLGAWRRFRSALEIRRLRKQVRDLEAQQPAPSAPVPASTATGTSMTPKKAEAPTDGDAETA
ncbi:MAG: LapA family protein [Candidatus Dadabacteria bacterium]|nr:MAG: LapA family protein [Candidatus Dadabacteria bacterium]